MEHEIDTEGALHRITVEDLDEEDQPEYVELVKPAVYEPEGSDTVYIAFAPECEDPLYIDTGLIPNQVYGITKA